MSNEGVTIITPTGGRPEALELCVRYVARQTWSPIQWIVVDDGDPISPVPPDFTFEDFVRVYPKPAWQPGQNTLARNILAALPEVKHDVVFFFEDDDWYAADYIETQMQHLGEDFSIVGEVPARYYHLPTQQYRLLDNWTHASLCQTGIRREVFPLLEDLCRSQDQTFLDVRLWRQCKLSRSIHSSNRSVGIKGMPGRAGIGVGHRPENIGGWRQDPDLSVLSGWIGEDLELYRERFKALGGAEGYKTPTPTPPTRPSDSYVAKNTVLGAPEGRKSAADGVFIPPEPFPSQPDFEEFFHMGQRRYKCNQVWESGAPCEYDTYDLRTLLEHVREPHNRSGKVSERVQRQRESRILDPAGKNIVVTEPAPEYGAFRFKEDHGS